MNDPSEYRGTAAIEHFSSMLSQDPQEQWYRSQTLQVQVSMAYELSSSNDKSAPDIVTARGGPAFDPGPSGEGPY